MKNTKTQALFTRSASVARVIERLIRATNTSADAALYRLSHPRLARAFHDAAQRGVRVRIILDRDKYKMTQATKKLLADLHIPYRLMSGRRGRWAKMHHKFAILDGRVALTGSYNWTLESEEKNFENLMILHDRQHVKDFLKEFEALWRATVKRGKS